ncbi:MAG: GNAT family N-acetyltransferase [Miltoncostaeaceae bacterium]
MDEHSPNIATASPEASVEVWHAFDEIEQEWEALAERADAVPFARPGWYRAWWNAFSRGELEIVGVRAGDLLTGVLPMERRKGVLATLTNDHTPAFGLLARDAAAARDLMEAVLSRGGRRATLVFLEADDLEAAVEGARLAGRRAVVADPPFETSPYVDLSGTYEEFSETLNTKVRGEIRRRWRKLEKEGEVEVDIRDGSDGLDALLVEGFAIEPSGWKAEQGTAIVSSPTTERFYTEVARWAAEKGLLRLVFLRLNGKGIAFKFGIESGGAFYSLKSGFDVEFRKLAPQKVLNDAMMRRGFEIGLSSFEFLGNADSWKCDWTSTLRERHLVHTFAPVTGIPEWLGVRFGPRRVTMGLAYR